MGNWIAALRVVVSALPIQQDEFSQVIEHAEYTSPRVPLFQSGETWGEVDTVPAERAIGISKRRDEEVQIGSRARSLLPFASVRWETILPLQWQAFDDLLARCYGRTATGEGESGPAQRASRTFKPSLRRASSGR